MNLKSKDYFNWNGIKWNSIRLGGPAHGIVTKTVHKTLPGVVGVQGVGGMDGVFDMKLTVSV